MGCLLSGAESVTEKKDKGPTGKQFFRQMEADAAAKVILVTWSHQMHHAAAHEMHE